MTEENKITIGGSEISIVMGLNRWKTPLRLWAEKTGELEREDISDKEYVQLGSELEEFIAKKFEQKTGKKVRRDTKTFIHKDFDFAIAHIDRRIQGVDEVLECKNASQWKAKEWEDEEIPAEYILQVQWYLGVLGMPRGYIAVLIGGNQFKYKEVLFDKELFDKLIEQARLFVKMVREKTPPIAISGDSDTLKELYPKELSSIIESKDGDIDELVGDLQFVKSQIIELEADKETKEALLKQKIGEASGIDTINFKVSWKEQTSKRVDNELLKADGLYEKYLKVAFSRVLRVTKKKNENEKSKKAR